MDQGIDTVLAHCYALEASESLSFIQFISWDGLTCAGVIRAVTLLYFSPRLCVHCGSAGCSAHHCHSGAEVNGGPNISNLGDYHT